MIKMFIIKEMEINSQESKIEMHYNTNVLVSRWNEDREEMNVER